MLRRARVPGILSQVLSRGSPTTLQILRQPQFGVGKRFNSTSSTSITPNALPDQAFLAKGKGREKTDSDKKIEEAAKTFEIAGLNPRLSLQLVNAFPAIRSPTPAQQALLAAISQDNDMILRAHTGTGKSFALLLGLLNKPRLVVQENNGESSSKSKRITSIVVVPSRELAMQYQSWAKQLFPKNMHHTLPSVVAIKYRQRDVSVDQHLEQLLKDPPHILVITATLFNDMMKLSKGPPILSIPTLRTLVLDEVDSLLDLPGRYPTQKLIWKHLQHPSDALQALNFIMSSRSTHSGGDPLPSAGLETSSKGISADLRRRIHQGNDLLQERSQTGKKQKFTLNPAKSTSRGEKPLQLIAVSATANAVLRNFLGAKTGWLRTGLRDGAKKETGKWLDLTGLSKGVNKGEEVDGLEEHTQVGWALQLPKELKHSCVVVDEPTGDGELINWRALNPARARRAREEEEIEDEEDKTRSKKVDPRVDDSGPLIVSATESSNATLDDYLLTCLAFLFASQPVGRALALIPATWSLVKTRSFLTQLDVPVRFVDEEPTKMINATTTTAEEEEGSEVLYLIQSNSVRGLDFPGGISHVFCVGKDSVRDATNYTHLAGRAARIGHDGKGGHGRPIGHVITLIRGLSRDEVRKNRGKKEIVASSELKMSVIYKRLGLRVERLKNLTIEEVEEGGVMAEAEEESAQDIFNKEERAEAAKEAEADSITSSTVSKAINSKPTNTL